MRLLAEFSHPAQVHKFKNVFNALEQQGHKVRVLSRDKDVMLPLLEANGVDHVCVSKARSGLLGLACELVQREIRVLVEFLRFKPDICLSAHSVAITHSAWLFRKPCIVHDDTEHASLQQRLYIPFATTIITTTAYQKDFGKRQLRIDSLEPLAYLHPNNFEVKMDTLPTYGIERNSKYAVVRFISWGAAHDSGLSESSDDTKRRIIDKLLEGDFTHIILSSEGNFTYKDPRVLSVRPNDFHQVLAGSSLCMTEGGSVAYESAVLGVPTIYANPLQTGIATELERLGLIIQVDNLKLAEEQLVRMLNNPDTKSSWNNARDKMLKVKSDMAYEIEQILLNASKQRSS